MKQIIEKNDELELNGQSIDKLIKQLEKIKRKYIDAEMIKVFTGYYNDFVTINIKTIETDAEYNKRLKHERKNTQRIHELQRLENNKQEFLKAEKIKLLEQELNSLRG